MKKLQILPKLILSLAKWIEIMEYQFWVREKEGGQHIMSSFIHSLMTGKQMNGWASYTFLREFFVLMNCTLSGGYVSKRK